jgi:hypothetical protein
MQTLRHFHQSVNTALCVALVWVGGIFCGIIYSALAQPVCQRSVRGQGSGVRDQGSKVLAVAVCDPENKQPEIRTVMRLPATQPAAADEAARRRIFKAICLWEGRGKIACDAVNEAEGAHGPAQIRQGYLTDSGLAYTLQDCHDYEISYQVAVAYWQRYGLVTDEQRARGHNGGPKGPQRASTLAYWAGVKGYLQ